MTIKRVLLVDDSPTERHIISEILTKAGYEVSLAEDGEKGVALAKSLKPDFRPRAPSLKTRKRNISLSSCVPPKTRRRTRCGVCVKAPGTMW
jgi:hypothetical protein